MKKHRVISFVLSAAACIGIALFPLSASAAPVSIQHRCYFYEGNQCYDHWIPTTDSCRGIFNKKVPAWEQMACLQLFGPSRG